ncbi:MAG: type III-A CRISPR-associated RAMP protein Csm3 [Prevotellaceae bacterium]|jgi:CRISPR-associated protein Csm3|nr:type III-A CRISPR-associated RAMP protein Csm3 [Prevotellaceae bacterium]
MKLEGTKIVKGIIRLESGLHIGGSKSSLDIGGLDSPVIKTPQGIPYIPGSSLKGKIRSLLGLKEGSHDVKDDSPLLKKMFGYQGGNNNSNDGEISRLIFRDALLDTDHFEERFKEKDAVLETDFTEAKWENTINRVEGKAKNGGLRQLERVPAGAQFDFEIVINIFDIDSNINIEEKLKEGLALLENNYLGGSGSRGYGKVSIKYEIS